MIRPYYEHAGITIYHGDCREVLPLLALDRVALVLTDPPYGISERTARQQAGRGGGGKNWPSRDFPPIYDDGKPFDPSHLLQFKRLILFGANYYIHKLPVSGSWIVWDKRDGLSSKRGPDTFADGSEAELAWSSIGNRVRVYSHRWTGLLRASEIGEPRLHPTQKPVFLMQRVIEEHTNPGDLILDPYMGSGSTLRAAKNLDRRAIGIEIEERYCEVAARRLSQEVMAL